MPEMIIETKPENYRNADAATRRRIRAAVVTDYGGRAKALVRRHVPASHYDDGEQAAFEGLLVALEKYEPERLGDDRGEAFWYFASMQVRKELQRLVNHGVNWRPDTSGAKGRVAHKEHMRPASLDAPRAEGDESTLHDLLWDDDAPTPENLVQTAEGVAIVLDFVRALSAEDRKLLLVERRNREAGVSKTAKTQARRYLALVERVTALVRGSDDDGSRSAVRRDRETLRP